MNDKIMDLIHNRLDIGKAKYGHDNVTNDGRDFVKEALEEVLDCMVYSAAKLIEIQEKKDERKRQRKIWSNII